MEVGLPSPHGRGWGSLALCLLVVGAAFELGACTSDDGPPPDLNDGPLVQVTESTSMSGAYQVAVLAHTSDLTRGNYDLEYIVTSTSDSTPVEGITMTIVPWMPAMGHGTPIVPAITSLGNGTYSLTNIDLFMAGLWQLRTTTTDPADQVEPALQIK
jgi:hypothetical protein